MILGSVQIALKTILFRKKFSPKRKSINDLEFVGEK